MMKSKTRNGIIRTNFPVLKLELLLRYTDNDYYENKNESKDGMR